MKWLAGCVAILMGSATAWSAPTAHVLNTNTTVHRVNVANNAELLVNTIPFMSDSLAQSPSGTLFSADAFGNLWNVTGPPIPVAPLFQTGIGDLDYANGGLWGYSNTSQELFFFNLTILAQTSSSVVNLPTGAIVTGVAYHQPTGDLYLSAHWNLNDDVLFRVPFASSSALAIGPMTIGDSFSYISDIDFDGAGNLHAVTWFHRHFYTVSLTTAATSLVSVGPHRDTTAMALVPTAVPAPAAALIFGSMLLRRRRARN